MNEITARVVHPPCPRRFTLNRFRCLVVPHWLREQPFPERHFDVHVLCEHEPRIVGAGHQLKDPPRRLAMSTSGNWAGRFCVAADPERDVYHWITPPSEDVLNKPVRERPGLPCYTSVLFVVMSLMGRLDAVREGDHEDCTAGCNL